MENSGKQGEYKENKLKFPIKPLTDNAVIHISF